MIPKVICLASFYVLGSFRGGTVVPLTRRRSRVIAAHVVANSLGSRQSRPFTLAVTSEREPTSIPVRARATTSASRIFPVPGLTAAWELFFTHTEEDG